MRALVDPSSSVSTADKLALFRAAIAHHGKDMKLASSGSGIDRHLFGLKMLAATSSELTDAERKEVLEGDGLFADPIVKESGTWRMSTSQVYIRHAPVYGWGPVVEGGVGLPYMIRACSFASLSRRLDPGAHSACAFADPHELQLSVSCQRGVPGADFIENFERAADMLMDLHEEASREQAHV